MEKFNRIILLILIQTTKKFLLFLFCLLFALSCLAQNKFDYHNLRFDYFNTDNGLSNNNVSCFLQDKKGFMWIGTSSGLNRFDGYNFKVFRHDPSDSTSIAAEDIICLYEDDEGFIWIGTSSGGLNRLDPRTEKFKAWMHNDTIKNSIPGNSIKSICAAPNHCLWLASNNGVIYFDPLRETFKSYLHDAKDSTTISKNDIISVSLFNDKLWIATYDKGINILDTKNGKVKRLPLFTTGAFPDNWDYTRQFIKYNDTMVVVLAGFGIIGVNPVTYKQTQLLDSLDGIQFLKDDNEWLWIAGRNCGLIFFNPITREFIPTIKSELNQPGVTDVNGNAVYKSREGTYWLGRFLSGIQRTNPSAQNFQILNAPHKIPSDNSNYMMSFAEDDSNLWVGTFSADFHQYKKSNGYFEFVKTLDASVTGILNRFPICMAMEGDQNLWQGHFSINGGVFCYNTKTHKLDSLRRHKADGDNAISENNCTALLIDSDIVWIGTPRMGLDRYDRRTKTFTHYRNDKNNPHSFPGSWVNAIRKLNNEIWIGSNGGLSKFNADGTFTNYTHNDTNVFSMGGLEVTCMNFDNKGRLWSGTLTGDMNIFNPEQKKSLHIKLFSGKKKAGILGLLIDNAGKIWMSTDAGITTFTPPQNLDSYFERKTNITQQEWDKYFRYYDKSDGLPFEIYNEYAYYKTRDGKLLFGSQNGATVIDPGKMFYNTVPPEVVFTNFSLFNQEVIVGDTTGILKRSIAYADEIILQPQQNVFTIEFSALNYIGSIKNKFQYMMEGFDKQWTETDYKKRSATYTQLPPGDYVFHVKASNNDGVWNEKGAAMKIIVLPYWWQTWWFRIAIVIAIIVIAWMTVRANVSRRLEKQRTEFEKQQRVLNERTRIASELHDDLGSGLTKISMMSQMAGSMKDEKQIQTLNKITIESSEMVDKMNGIIWALNTKNDSLPNLISFIRKHAFELFDDSQIKLMWEADDEIPEVPVTGEVRRNIYLTVKEALHNALKYSGAEEVKVKVKVKESSLEITIYDCGKGFDLAMITGKGNGLQNMKKRMEETGGNCYINSEVNKGTTITISCEINPYTKV